MQNEQDPRQVIKVGLQVGPMALLEQAKTAIIMQQIELSEILTGCETANRYHVSIKAPDGNIQPLFRCKEDSGWCMRNCCSSDSRSFKMNVKDVSQKLSEEEYKKNFCVFERPFKCTCCCLARPEIRGYFGSSLIPIGKLVQPFTCFDPIFEIYNSREEQRYMVTTECCQCGYLCRGIPCGKCSDVHFPIHNANKQNPSIENKDGLIKKVFAGITQETISDADNFNIVFPIDATAEDKLMIIGTVLMIDYTFYEDRGGSGKIRTRKY
jgi:hypothetical protein